MIGMKQIIFDIFLLKGEGMRNRFYAIDKFMKTTLFISYIIRYVSKIVLVLKQDIVEGLYNKKNSN